MSAVQWLFLELFSLSPPNKIVLQFYRKLKQRKTHPRRFCSKNIYIKNSEKHEQLIVPNVQNLQKQISSPYNSHIFSQEVQIKTTQKKQNPNQVNCQQDTKFPHNHLKTNFP